jgi:hypothetical protein
MPWRDISVRRKRTLSRTSLGGTTQQELKTIGFSRGALRPVLR